MNNDNQKPDCSKRLPEMDSGDLSWLAFCYVANELDPHTRRRFEIRLEQDQTARDAIVEALDNARMLDFVLSPAVDEPEEASCELPKRELKQGLRTNPARSTTLWQKALLGIVAAGLLVIMLPQIRWKPTVEITRNTNSSTPIESTGVLMALAETWADFSWDAAIQVEIAEDDLVRDIQSSDTLDELHQDDWMTTTLIDMAQDLDSSSSAFGS